MVVGRRCKILRAVMKSHEFYNVKFVKARTQEVRKPQTHLNQNERVNERINWPPCRGTHRAVFVVSEDVIEDEREHGDHKVIHLIRYHVAPCRLEIVTSGQTCVVHRGTV